MAAKTNFAGRRVSRVGRHGVWYDCDDSCSDLVEFSTEQNEHLCELRQRVEEFRQVAGDSDQEDEFNGFSSSDICDTLSRKADLENHLGFSDCQNEKTDSRWTQTSDLLCKQFSECSESVPSKSAVCESQTVRKCSRRGAHHFSKGQKIASTTCRVTSVACSISRPVDCSARQNTGQAVKPGSSLENNSTRRKLDVKKVGIAPFHARNRLLHVSPTKSFCLPTRSSHSSRIIKPNKRFIDNDHAFDFERKRQKIERPRSASRHAIEPLKIDVNCSPTLNRRSKNAGGCVSLVRYAKNNQGNMSGSMCHDKLSDSLIGCNPAGSDSANSLSPGGSCLSEESPVRSPNIANIILQKPKLCFDQEAVNRSKVALARSLQRTMVNDKSSSPKFGSCGGDSRSPGLPVTAASLLGSSANREPAERESGPRIKHVCRRAAVVFGERATFPLLPASSEINLSALPLHEKKHLLLQPVDGDSDVEDMSDCNDRTDRGCRNHTSTGKQPPHVSRCVNSTTTCSRPEPGRTDRAEDIRSAHVADERCLFASPSASDVAGCSPGKVSGDPRIGIESTEDRASSSLRKRLRRCFTCAGCLATDCGICHACRGMVKFGGQGLTKKACLKRRCLAPLSPKFSAGIKLPPDKSFTTASKVERCGSVGSGNLDAQNTDGACISSSSALPASLTFGASGESVGELQCTPLSSQHRPAPGRHDNVGTDSSPKMTWSKRRHRRLLQKHVSPSCEKESPMSSPWPTDVSVVTTSPTGLRAVCLLCGSLGCDEADALVYCAVCCQSFHVYCLPLTCRPRGVGAAVSNWCCLKCRCCRVCGLDTSEPLLNCDSCLDCFHRHCLGPDYTAAESARKPWLCELCAGRCTCCRVAMATIFDTSAGDVRRGLCSRCVQCVHNKCLVSELAAVGSVSRAAVVPHSTMESSSAASRLSGCNDDHSYSESSSDERLKSVVADGSSVFPPDVAVGRLQKEMSRLHSVSCSITGPVVVVADSSASSSLVPGASPLLLNASQSDNRLCVLCRRCGDFGAREGGRLLHAGKQKWVHVNCALWSAGVCEQQQTGILLRVHSTVALAKSQFCRVCGQRGASVRCSEPGCSSLYHFHCASAILCSFTLDKELFCPFHCPSAGGKSLLLDGLSVCRRLCIKPRQPHRLLTHCHSLPSVMSNWSSVSVLAGSLCVTSLGVLSPESDTEATLFPVGFSASRAYWSTVDARRRTTYVCRIAHSKLNQLSASETTRDLHSNEMSTEITKTRHDDSMETSLCADITQKSLDPFSKVLDVEAKMMQENEAISTDAAANLLSNCSAVCDSLSVAATVCPTDWYPTADLSTSEELLGIDSASPRVGNGSRDDSNALGNPAEAKEVSMANVADVEISSAGALETLPSFGDIFASIDSHGSSNAPYVSDVRGQNSIVMAELNNPSTSGSSPFVLITETVTARNTGGKLSVKNLLLSPPVDNAAKFANIPCQLIDHSSEHNPLICGSQHCTAPKLLVQLDGTLPLDSDSESEDGLEMNFVDGRHMSSGTAAGSQGMPRRAATSKSTEGQFKCGKCRRIYRTAQSCATHSESCSFVVSSSSSSDSDDATEDDGECNSNHANEYCDDNLELIKHAVTHSSDSDDEYDDDVYSDYDDDDEVAENDEEDENDMSDYLFGVEPTSRSLSYINKVHNLSMSAAAAAHEDIMATADACDINDNIPMANDCVRTSSALMPTDEVPIDDMPVSMPVSLLLTKMIEDSNSGVLEDEMRKARQEWCATDVMEPELCSALPAPYQHCSAGQEMGSMGILDSRVSCGDRKQKSTDNEDLDHDAVALLSHRPSDTNCQNVFRSQTSNDSRVADVQSPTVSNYLTEPDIQNSVWKSHLSSLSANTALTEVRETISDSTEFRHSCSSEHRLASFSAQLRPGNLPDVVPVSSVKASIRRSSRSSTTSTTVNSLDIDSQSSVPDDIEDSCSLQDCVIVASFPSSISDQPKDCERTRAEASCSSPVNAATSPIKQSLTETASSSLPVTNDTIYMQAPPVFLGSEPPIGTPSFQTALQTPVSVNYGSSHLAQPLYSLLQPQLTVVQNGATGQQFSAIRLVQQFIPASGAFPSLSPMVLPSQQNLNFQSLVMPGQQPGVVLSQLVPVNQNLPFGFYSPTMTALGINPSCSLPQVIGAMKPAAMQHMMAPTLVPQAVLQRTEAAQTQAPLSMPQLIAATVRPSLPHSAPRSQLTATTQPAILQSIATQLLVTQSQTMAGAHIPAPQQLLHTRPVAVPPTLAPKPAMPPPVRQAATTTQSLLVSHSSTQNALVTRQSVPWQLLSQPALQQTSPIAVGTKLLVPQQVSQQGTPIPRQPVQIVLSADGLSQVSLCPPASKSINSMLSIASHRPFTTAATGHLTRPSALPHTAAGRSFPPPLICDMNASRLMLAGRKIEIPTGQPLQPTHAVPSLSLQPQCPVPIASGASCPVLAISSEAVKQSSTPLELCQTGMQTAMKELPVTFMTSAHLQASSARLPNQSSVNQARQPLLLSVATGRASAASIAGTAATCQGLRYPLGIVLGQNLAAQSADSSSVSSFPVALALRAFLPSLPQTASPLVVKDVIGPCSPSLQVCTSINVETANCTMSSLHQPGSTVSPAPVGQSTSSLSTVTSSSNQFTVAAQVTANSIRPQLEPHIGSLSAVCTRSNVLYASNGSTRQAVGFDLQPKPRTVASDGGLLSMHDHHSPPCTSGSQIHSPFGFHGSVSSQLSSSLAVPLQHSTSGLTIRRLLDFSALCAQQSSLCCALSRPDVDSSESRSLSSGNSASVLCPTTLGNSMHVLCPTILGNSRLGNSRPVLHTVGLALSSPKSSPVSSQHTEVSLSKNCSNGGVIACTKTPDVSPSGDGTSPRTCFDGPCVVTPRSAKHQLCELGSIDVINVSSNKWLGSSRTLDGEAHDSNLNSMETDANTAANQNKFSPVALEYLKAKEMAQSDKSSAASVTGLVFEISSEDGFYVQAGSCDDAWRAVVDGVQEARHRLHMKPISFAAVNSLEMFGLAHEVVQYLLEQLPGIEICQKYRRKFDQQPNLGLEVSEKSSSELLSATSGGCARLLPFQGRKPPDAFSFLLSKHRRPPPGIEPRNVQSDGEALSLSTSNNKLQRRHGAVVNDVPMVTRFRELRLSTRDTVAVYHSLIHGRGLYARRDIDSGEMVIEYAGEVIRAVLTDRREQLYERTRPNGSDDFGCYMFRLSDTQVVDATVAGNVARFINHSCEPNCFSKVVDDGVGQQHIVIFALRPIARGEELTYDYKFPVEEVKIACMCGARRCKKYLN